MSDAETLTPEEVRAIRSILRGIAPDEWRILKGIAAGALGRGAGAKAATASGPVVAEDPELSSRFGDPTVRKDPKHWAGDSYAGARYSECPSDYLIVLAESIEYFADKDQKKPDPPKHQNGTPWWQLNLKDAARARGWARRNQGKAKPPPQQDTSTADNIYDQTPAEEYADGSEEYVP